MSTESGGGAEWCMCIRSRSPITVCSVSSHRICIGLLDAIEVPLVILETIFDLFGRLIRSTSGPIETKKQTKTGR